MEELLLWVSDDEAIPRTVAEANFSPDRLDRLQSRLSAAYKGINMLVLRDGAKDFFWKAEIKELGEEGIDLDIHHIFPKAWCESNSISSDIYNSIINKTPISYKANRMIGGSAPSVYLHKLQQHTQVQMQDAEMDELVKSHLINEEALRANDFNKFYQMRKESLLNLISKAMGK